MIPWLRYGDPKWDQAMCVDLLEGRLAAGGHRFERFGPFDDPFPSGAVILAPVGEHAHTDLDVERLHTVLDLLDWAVLLLTADEASSFPWRDLKHPNMRVWIQTPRPLLHQGHDRFLLVGYPPGAPQAIAQAPYGKELDWAFLGQINHRSRRELAHNLNRFRVPGIVMETGGFTQGMPQEEYWWMMANAKMAPCPSGPRTPDTFRMAEALEAGCVPLVAAFCQDYDEEFWPLVLPGAPFPLVTDWANVADAVDYQLSEWPKTATRCSAWWQGYKRAMHWWVNDDVTEVSGIAPEPWWGTASTTVLIPTSPIPSHPSTEIIEETVVSVRHWLPDAEILVLCDGVRPEQEGRRTSYEQYLNRLVWLCEHHWGNAVPLIFEAHTHQANMTRRALELVRTPTITFVEADCPLVTDRPIDWSDIFDLVAGGAVNLLRFHHEAQILPEHEHLMVDHSPIDVDGVPLQRTFQWSQRPHVANTDYYRHIIDKHFRPTQKAMIEDVMHSVIQQVPWGAHRVAVYTPPDVHIKRSTTTDGRGDDEKWESELS